MADSLTTINDVLRSVIEQRVLTEWVVSIGGSRRSAIQFPGVNELLAVDGSMLTEPPVDTPWLKVEIQWFETEPLTFAGGASGALNRNTGAIVLKVFTPNGLGTSQLEQLKGHARKIFSRFHGDGLRCLASSPGPNLTEKSWMFGTITTNFEAYENAV